MRATMQTMMQTPMASDRRLILVAHTGVLTMPRRSSPLTRALSSQSKIFLFHHRTFIPFVKYFNAGYWVLR
jgi:hypothetical protein